MFVGFMEANNLPPIPETQEGSNAAVVIGGIRWEVLDVDKKVASYRGRNNYERNFEVHVGYPSLYYNPRRNLTPRCWQLSLQPLRNPSSHFILHALVHLILAQRLNMGGYDDLHMPTIVLCATHSRVGD